MIIAWCAKIEGCPVHWETEAVSNSEDRDGFTKEEQMRG